MLYFPDCIIFSTIEIVLNMKHFTNIFLNPKSNMLGKMSFCWTMLLLWQLFKIGKTATETYQLLQQTYGEVSMGRAQVFDWFRLFKEGRTSVESDPRSGRRSTSRNEELIAKDRTIVRNNERLTVREIAEDCGISVGSCDAILTGKMVGWRLDTSSRQCARTHFTSCAAVLAKHGTAQLQQPPYSPDLAPCDFFLFPRLKKILKGCQFEATEDIKRNSTKTLLDIPKEELVKCFEQWQKRWAKCVAAEGNCGEDN